MVTQTHALCFYRNEYRLFKYVVTRAACISHAMLLCIHAFGFLLSSRKRDVWRRLPSDLGNLPWTRRGARNPLQTLDGYRVWSLLCHILHQCNRGSGTFECPCAARPADSTLVAEMHPKAESGAFRAVRGKCFTDSGNCPSYSNMDPENSFVTQARHQ